MALCLTHTPQIPLAAVTPLTIANSREFLASSIISQSLPSIDTIYAPFAPLTSIPTTSTDQAAAEPTTKPTARKRRRNDALGDAEQLPPRKRPPPGAMQESELSIRDIPPPDTHGEVFTHDLRDPNRHKFFVAKSLTPDAGFLKQAKI